MRGVGKMAIRMAMAALALSAGPALANGGGGEGAAANPCPWAQDVTMELNGRQLVLPQATFDPKAHESYVDDYQIVPSLDQLKMVVIGPHGHMWEAALTRLSGGKKCLVYYVGKPVLIATPSVQSPLPRATRTAGH